MKKLLMCVAMVAMLAACSKGDGEDGFILSPMSDPDNVCSAMDDIYFMQYCYQKFDVNGDAKVSKTEAAAVTSINFSYGDYYSIKSIRGIEYFVNLEDIDGDALGIEVVDLRANTKLQKVEFSSCDDLVEVRLPNSVTSINFYDCSSLAIVAIPDSVTSIGDDAFSGCSSLASITIPEGVASIRDYAFKNCLSLMSVTIPGSVTSIGRYAFDGCSSLTSITIPEGVTSIGGYAFYGCSSLMNVYCKPTTPPRCVRWMFDYDVSGRKIYVPRASVDAYKQAAGWIYYADEIVGYDF